MMGEGATESSQELPLGDSPRTRTGLGSIDVTDRRLLGGSVAVALVWAAWHAWDLRWISDDAYISFRYARNLVEGVGLVFNEGEYVEGFSNFLWTLGATVPIRLGASPERWTQFWGIACYLAGIALLGLHHLRARSVFDVRGASLPVAALAAAAMHDWQTYATSGLETSAFTTLGLVGALLLLHGDSARARPAALAGLAFALAALTRPEGLLLGCLGGMFVLWDGRSDPHVALRRSGMLAAAFFAVWLPYTLWRVHYFGDFLPNTFYAKSADQAWYEQGGHYLRLFYERYWALALGVAAFPLALAWQRAGRTGTHEKLRLAVLPATFAGVYTFYVVRIGGDFMYARMLIPTLPFVVLLLDWVVLCLPNPRARIAVGLMATAALILSASPLEGIRTSHGIRDEQLYYPNPADDPPAARAQVLERYFRGLDVRVPFTGSDARLVYAARIPVAIESVTGLTDRYIAHQTLEKRGRVGHEKNAPLEYLLRERGVHFALRPQALKVLRVEGQIPVYEISFDGVRGFILRWDRELLSQMRDRGAVFEDFMAQLDSLIEQLPELESEQVGNLYESMKLFYFDHNADPEREAAFLERLGR